MIRSTLYRGASRARCSIFHHGVTTVSTAGGTLAALPRASITPPMKGRAAFSTTAPSYPIVPKSDFGRYKEYSVIHTDRSLNLMSDPFGSVMRDLNQLLKHTYQAHQVAIIPGSGTFGMEAVARQFGNHSNNMVLRNGWFSYRWTEILDMMGVETHAVLKAQPTTPSRSSSSNGHSSHPQFAPAPLEQVLEQIRSERPRVFYMPHVETSTGMMVPDDYITHVAQAVHEVGGLVVLDCIASGTVWVDMKQTGVDVLISAPQKGWTGAPCAALVMTSERAVDAMHSSNVVESSFSLSLKRWSAIMQAYEKGGFAYHTTMPTDALRDFHEVTVETLSIGLPALKQKQLNLGWKARAILDSKGLVSVAAPGSQSPGVLVYHSPGVGTENPVMMKAFHEQGLQIAMGVPWKIDEPTGLKTFRIGLFGLDKLEHIDETCATMEHALDCVLEKTTSSSNNSEVA